MHRGITTDKASVGKLQGDIVVSICKLSPTMSKVGWEHGPVQAGSARNKP